MITGSGVAAEEAQAEIRSDRVEMPGLVDDERLEHELRGATLALVSQSYEGTEFNLPSKLMNYMAYGLPVIAAVNPAGEVARLVNESGGGWVADSSDPDSFPRAVATALDDPDELRGRGDAARRFARAELLPSRVRRQLRQRPAAIDLTGSAEPPNYRLAWKARAQDCSLLLLARWRREFGVGSERLRCGTGCLTRSENHS